MTSPGSFWFFGMKKLIIVLVVLGIAAVISVALGVFLLFYFDVLMKKRVFENVVLREGSETFNKWKEINGSIDFYLFNVTNAEEVVSKNVKPEVDELGPYQYRELKKKINIKFDESNGTVTYKEQKHYFFKSSMGLAEDDLITVLNLPAVIISKILEDKLPKIFLPVIKWFLKFEGLFQKRMVKEILWGYNATLAITINEFLKKFHLPVITFPEFGLNVGKRANGSLSEVFNISTGLININELGIIHLWNNTNKLPYWSGMSCDKINGTDGTFWSPFVDKSRILYVFNPEVCRSIGLEYNSDQKVMDAPVYKFTVPLSAFLDYRNSSEFQCFCMPNIESCLKQGVLDISTCNDGVPIVLSLPHFLNSDPEYIDAIHGMSPNISKHETFINVEPHIGTVLQAHKRLQINILMRDYEVFLASSGFKKSVIFPIAWADEHGILSPEDSKELDEKLYRPLLAAQVIQYGLISLGCVFFVIIIFIKVVEYKRNQIVKLDVDETSPLVSERHSSGHST